MELLHPRHYQLQEDGSSSSPVTSFAFQQSLEYSLAVEMVCIPKSNFFGT